MSIELILCLVCEIDNNVAAEDQVKSRLELILQEIVPLELDHTLDLWFYSEVIPVFFEILAAAIRCHAFDLIRCIDAALCLCQNLNIEIGCQNTMARSGRHLLHDNGEGIRLCPDRTARTPNIEFGRSL